MEYTVAEIRNGSGFPKGAKFVMVAPGRSAVDVLREFVADVQSAGGVKKLAAEWPDLAVTYTHAVEALGMKGAR